MTLLQATGHLFLKVKRHRLDCISSGALTKDVKAIDLSMRITALEER